MKRRMNTIPFGQLKDSILIVRVGTADRPAGIQDINDMIEKLHGLLSDFEGCKVLVTHHAVDFELLGTKGLKNISKIIERKRQKAKSKVKNAILSLE